MQSVIQNIRNVRQISGDAMFMAVVKSNAYGLGLVEFARNIEPSIDRFGVSNVEEANKLLQNGITKPVHVLAPYFDDTVSEGIIPTIDRIEDLRRYDSICELKGYHGRFHLKINTGMNRFGLEIDQIDEFMRVLQNCSHIAMEGVFTHFGSTYAKHRKFTRKQWMRFMFVKDLITMNHSDPLIFHMANSAACIDFPESRLDMVRIGNAMYGFQSASTDIGLLPTYHIKANVMSVRFVSKGDFIGYGCTFKANRNMWAAVISFGGYDGFGLSRQPKSILRDIYHRLFPKPKLFIHGQPVTPLGNASMTYIIADVSHLNAKPGDTVVIKVDSILSLKETIERKYVI
ncbi:alanine racemase [Cohnella lupini]|uniref:Alanine racemase n=2 Tax=Cohnella lupini TaxID=1294267 RepID=A0A3D9ISQ4_9BACL|nr:alanine racemase [Cohnella lupini]